MLKVFDNIFLLFISIFIFVYFLFFDKSLFGSNYFFELISFSWFKIKYIFMIDGISLFFVILSSFLLGLCILISWIWSYKINIYVFCIFLSMICLLNIFMTIDFFVLFFFFELIVVPLFLLVGIWGSRDRKIYAAYLLFIYTLIGSIFALFAFIFLYSNKGISNFLFFLNFFVLEYYQIVLFVLLFLGFAVKVPIIPIHVWLPEAHVEAPTSGSVILAGIVLKLGFYVYIRLLVFTFASVLYCLMNIIFIISLLGLYLPSFFALSQIDIKKIIAYSSISHMNFSLIGLFCGNFISIFGSFFMMFGHAIVSSALFASIGILYDRYKTRLIFYYGGLVLLMPFWALFFFVFILGNFGLPGTVNFVGEFTIFLGSFIVNNLIIFFSLFGLFLTLVYSLFLYTKLANGIIKIEFIRFFGDLTRREFFILFPLFFFVIFFGLFPNILFDYSFSSIYYWFFFS
jgi:proton-translocating NADH-quinone oxidoreductase chain M